MTSMESGKANSERLRGLVAKIGDEKDYDKFTALIRELNRLLDGEPPSPSPNRN